MSLPTLGNDDKKKPGGLPSIDMPPIDDDNMPSSDEQQSSMPSLDEQIERDRNEFEEVSVEEALYEEDDEDLNEDIYENIEEDEVLEKELPDMRKEEQDALADEDDYYPEYEEDKEVDEDKFINKKKKRLIPFGGKRSKKPKMLVKSSDFDDRKNKLAKTKVMQFSVLLIILLVFLLGLRNTFMPNHVYTGDQIRQFAKEGAGQTEFPQERGQEFVENFMSSYLTFDRTKPELLQMLSHYYGQERFSNDNYSNLNMDWDSDAKQKVVVPPKTSNVELLSDYSAQYEVTSYVTNTSGKYVADKEIIGRWLTFSVNVYYDEETNSLAITQDSPTIVPHKKIAEPTVIPEGKLLGNGEINKEILVSITPTIDGFVEAYAKSSIDSHNSILQYIKDEDDIELYDGFGGAVELEGDPENSINKVVYNTDYEGVYEVDVTVTWADAIASDLESEEGNSVEYTSRYQMTVETDSEGKFSVTSFSPYAYFK